MTPSSLLSVVGPSQLSKELLAELSLILQKENTFLKNQNPFYIQYKINGSFSPTLTQHLRQLSDQYKIDVAIIDENFTQKKKLLFIFDMDSTLVAAEVINVLADIHGVGDKVKEITKTAMNGGLSFDESLRIRLSMLKGMSRDQLIHVDEKLPLNPGVEKCMERLRLLGHKTAIASGGFNFFADVLKSRLQMDYSFSNELEFSNNALTGHVIGPIVNAEMKEKLVTSIAASEGLTPEDVVAVGDGANDLLMLARAHMGVAFHAKETVRAQAKFHISHTGMDTLLYYLGMQE